MYFLSYHFVLFVRDTLILVHYVRMHFNFDINIHVLFFMLLYYINLCVYLGPKRKILEFPV